MSGNGFGTAVLALGTDDILKAIPPIASAGFKFIDFRNKRKELAATQRQLSETQRELNGCREELKESTQAVALLTSQLAEYHGELDSLKVEYENYRETIQLLALASAALILILLATLVFTSTKHA